VTEVDLVGYCEPVSCRGGDTVELKLSAGQSVTAVVDIVEIVCGDHANPATGFVEREVAVPGFPVEVEVAPQPIVPGSFATFGPSPLLAVPSFTIGCSVRPSIRPDRPQTVLTIGGCTVNWSGQGFTLRSAGEDEGESKGEGQATGPLDHGRWYELHCSVDDGTATLQVSQVASHSPGGDSTSHGGICRVDGVTGGDLLTVGRGFDGRVAGLWLDPTVGSVDRAGAAFRWNAAIDTDTARWADTGDHGLHGTLHQLPARAVRGPAWDGSAQDPAAAPDHYDAVHFHTDDLYDAGWATTASLPIGADLPSGVYCFRSRGETGEDRTPFFVAAPPAERADVAFLVPMATYLAYANQRVHLTNPDFTPGGGPTPPNHLWIRDHPEIGYSHYEYHPDRSGVMFSSRRRPVMNLKPGADRWGFTPDTNIVAFLHHEGVAFDVVTDEHLHAEGHHALDGYRVVVTGSHPEYWSTAMLDAMEQWQREGGRLMYLGGNGFYWRVAFSSHWPGAMEVRRAEDGTRAWIAEPGEYHHAFGGEYGGLWRRLDRPPNLICGIGFAAQGFGRGAPYVLTHREPERTGWIFDGVEGDVIGAHGVGGGAAGQEIDRFDLRLGSPPHAVVLASATDHDESMLRTKEELHYTVKDARATSMVRADLVFYEVAGGGAVFSVGSIAWFGALATNGYGNDVARITANVLHGFRNPDPFEPPERRDSNAGQAGSQ
jgi:N,N-dimethylformamidase